MFKTDIIKTYIIDSKYYKSENMELLKIFNNNYILYLYIEIYNSQEYFKIKQIKQNYIISFSYSKYHENNINFTKIKNYDNRKINIINDYYKFNFDFKITKNAIYKKIDKDIYIIYYNIKFNIKDINIKAIRYHNFYNNKYLYYKKYITYYINYYIIIYSDIDNNHNIKSCNCNTIFCNFIRNIMLFI